MGEVVGRFGRRPGVYCPSREKPFQDALEPWLNKLFKHQPEFPLGDLLSFRALALRYNALSSTVENEVYELGPNQLRFHEIVLTQTEFQRVLQNLKRLPAAKLSQFAANLASLSHASIVGSRASAGDTYCAKYPKKKKEGWGPL